MIADHVLEYLQEIYNRGIIDGEKKARAVDVAYDMRRIRDAKGEFKFMPNEWLTEKQIKNYFRIMTAKLNKVDLITSENITHNG